MQMWSHVTHQTGDKAQGSLEEDTIKRCRQEQERALVTSPCTGNRERIRNRERGTSRERSRTKILRNDLSSRLEKSGSSPRQTYHSNVTTCPTTCSCMCSSLRPGDWEGEKAPQDNRALATAEKNIHLPWHH